MYAAISIYSQIELENAARFAIGSTVREMLEAVNANGWNWASNETAWLAADDSTVVYVRAEFDETGISYGFDCPAIMAAPVWVETIDKAVNTLAMLLA